jgi:hypothetical protein
MTSGLWVRLLIEPTSLTLPTTLWEGRVGEWVTLSDETQILAKVTLVEVGSDDDPTGGA